MLIYTLIQTNCDSSQEGQIIKVSLHASQKEAESAEKKSDFGDFTLDGIKGWWDNKNLQ